MSILGCATDMGKVFNNFGTFMGRKCTHCQLGARRALSIFKDILLRSRRALLLYKVHSGSTEV